MTSIRADWVFDGISLGANKTVRFRNGIISEIADRHVDATTSLPPGAILAPGFIDLQVNGGGGVMFNDSLDAHGLRRIAAAHAARGTTSILPTLISGSRSAIASAMAAAALSVPGVAGLHIEGPFITMPRRGIHPASAVRRIDDDDIRMLMQRIGVPLMVTLAPEAVSDGAIRSLVQSDVIVSIGHSDASYDVARAALQAGATTFTHLFNAMSPLTSREPGTVGAAMQSLAAYAGIIADGFHVHPATIAIAHAAMTAHRLFLVSDAMATTASDVTRFDLYGIPISLRDGRLSDAGGTLAGAHLTMAEAVRNAVNLAGIPLEDALRMATATPAACCRLHDRGIIAPGRRADLVALDAALDVIGVWQSGARL